MKTILAYSPSLQTKIRRIIADEQAKPNPAGSWRADFFKRLLPYTTSGKMIRGNLVCFSYEAFAKHKPRQPVTDVAAALEFAHSGLLIHDDVMDNDDFRRGRPSVHNQYRALADRTGLTAPGTFGVNMAICGADICLLLAMRLLADEPEISKTFSEILIRVCDGQMQDVYSQAHSETPSKQAINNMMRAKTATYTLSLPLMLGATLAGQPTATINKLRRLGDVIGVIFQIRDDELGVLGDTGKTGKPVGADIREGKKTLVYYYLMKKCDVRERRWLKQVFGNPSSTPEDIIAVQKLIRRRGIPGLLGNDINRLEKQALSLLSTLDLSSQYKTELQSLIDFCSKRHA